jgi:hypothetical protein
MDMPFSPDALATSIAGLLGVLVGALITPGYSTRFTERSNARLAARLAADRLEKWVRATEVADRQRTKFLGDDLASVHMAIAARAIRRDLSLRWWEENRLALMTRAKHADAAALSSLAERCGYYMFTLDQIGEGGEDVLMRVAELKVEKSQREQQLVREGRELIRNSGDDEPYSVEADPGDSDALGTEMAALRHRERQHDERIEEAARQLELGQFDLQILVAQLDHRVQLAESALRVLSESGDRFRAGTEVCRRIELYNTSALNRALRKASALLRRLLRKGDLQTAN